MTITPSPLAQQGGTLDIGALARRVNLLEAYAQDPNNVVFTGGLLGGVAVAALNAVTFIPIGDSITFTSGCAGLFEYLAALSGGKLYQVANAGVNGNTSTMMAARFATDVVALAPHMTFIMGSVNNIGAGISVAQLQADYTSMIVQARNAGIFPVIVASPPYDTAPSTISSYNLALMKLARSLRVAYVNPWTSNYNAADGHWVTGQTSDGTHPTQTAITLAAANLLAVLTLPSYQPYLPNNNADTQNKVTNGLFITNTVPGTPDGWTVPAGLTSSLTGSLTLPKLGNQFNMDFSALASYKTATGPISLSGLVAGDTIVALSRVKTVGFQANGNGPSPGQGKADAQTIVNFNGPGGGLALHPSIGGDIDGVFVAIGTIPTGTISLGLSTNIGPRSGTITGTYSLTQLAVFKLP